MRGEELTESDEGPHDRYVHLNGTLALENTGKHGDTLLGEHIGQVSPPSSPLGL
jgi:hypothetical protein